MKKENIKEIKKGEIIIYKILDKKIQVNVSLDKETIWLDAHQIAKIFDVNRPAIVKHINNIYKTAELEQNSTCSILEQVARDGRMRKMNIYNLDMILSVGYRVNSKQATQFRIWATKTLKDHLVQGFTINEKRILEAKEKFKELQSSILFLQEKAKHELLAGQEQEILSLLADYSKTLSLLEQYDTEKVALQKNGKGKFILDYENTVKVISQIKNDLVTKKEAGEFFGQENSDKIKAILGNILQTFDRKELYPSIEEKASHLLYFIIKDHPFVDGNKRIASFLFVYYLDKNNYLYKDNNEKKINDNALTALSLLIAVSDRNEKDKLVKIITNLLSN
jgi:death-on-curing family protein